MVDAVGQRLKQSISLIGWLDENIGSFEAPGGLRNSLPLACVELVRQHHRAIVILLSQRLYGSAAALLRPTFETYIRGVWIYRCATEEQIGKFVENVFEIKLGLAIRDIETLDDFNAGVLSEVKRANWEFLCSLAHGGIDALGRQINGNTIEPNFHAEEVIQMLKNADSIVLLSAFLIASLKGCSDLPGLLLAKAGEL